jgi:hypothetical protein
MKKLYLLTAEQAELARLATEVAIILKDPETPAELHELMIEAIRQIISQVLDENNSLAAAYPAIARMMPSGHRDPG